MATFLITNEGNKVGEEKGNIVVTFHVSPVICISLVAIRSHKNKVDILPIQDERVVQRVQADTVRSDVLLPRMD